MRVVRAPGTRLGINEKGRCATGSSAARATLVVTTKTSDTYCKLILSQCHLFINVHKCARATERAHRCTEYIHIQEHNKSYGASLMLKLDMRPLMHPVIHP